ncbi:MAG: ATP-binding protein [Thermoplasmata archaeon]|nr:MAG: ATP-binding protein [Thermoplasmata archaeon]
MNGVNAERARNMHDAVREDNGIGVIYGNVGTTYFDCSIVGSVEKNDYIQVWHDKHGWVLGQVVDLQRRTTLGTEDAKAIFMGEDVSYDEILIGRVMVIGYRDKKGLLRPPTTPFRAGEKVYRAEEDTIRRVLGLKAEKSLGAYIGKLYGHNIDVYLDINGLVQKHVSILAKTGGGKSYVAGVLIEELIKHDVTTVIIDPHGEYPSLKRRGKEPTDKRFGIVPRSYASKIIEFSPDTTINKDAKPLRFTLANITPRELLSLTNLKSGRTYLTYLRRALDYLRETKSNYTLSDVIAVLESEENPPVTLISELEYLREINLFAPQGTRINDLVVEGKTTIINLRGTPPDVQELVVSRVATALFELRKINKIPPLMMVVEEAHNYCPQQGVVASSKILRTIASEGRKFGFGLMIITQRPAKVDKNVLSQCNTQIILKVTNPHDLRAIISSVEGLTTQTADEIQRLPLGVAIVTSPNLSMPLFVEIRPRETMHGGESVRVV